MSEDRYVVQLMTPTMAAELRRQPVTYPEPVGTGGGSSASYRRLSMTRLLATGFAAAGERLMTWRVHEDAGLRVTASSERVEPGSVVELRLGFHGIGLRAPCRVVRVIDEQHRTGFAYATLPGHPESGEELFVVERSDDGAVTFTITAISRPASLPARAAGPLGRRLQDVLTLRYLRAIDRS